ncbi:hypothetical protein [uncultured Proteiniphilum sp.]|jgi:hypothetical protein|uniref:hypothetical protein n=1 Tax=uncultured Proteiniphilum sp. TaxID=497637 RepID=UPI00262701E0|nr:hypothetical protein [uncultured Proteiniphilum sp.]
MKDDSTPFKGMGSVQYGDIDDLLAYLALIPNEGRMVKMWERSIEKQLANYRHKRAIYDFWDLGEMPEGLSPEDKESVKREIVQISKRIASDIEEVKGTLGIDLSPEYADDLAWQFTYTEKNPILLKAIAGDNPRIGGKFLRVLTERQIEFLFNELTRVREVKPIGKMSFMEGDLKDFKAMFTGEGIDPGNFKPVNWLPGDKITLRVLIWGQAPIGIDKYPEPTIGLKSNNLKEKDIPKVCQTFFTHKGELISGAAIKNNPAKLENDPIFEELYGILKKFATIGD